MNNISVYSQNKLDGMLNTAITEANMCRVINRKNPVLMTLDSCFCMEKGSDRFLKEKVFPYLNGTKIYVEVAVLSELHKLAKDSDRATALKAKNALVFIAQHSQYFQIVGKETDGGSLADTFFLSLIAKRIGKYHVVLLTEDKKLMHSMQSMYCGMSCVHHKRSLTIIRFSTNRMQSWYDPTGVPPRKNSGFKLKFPNAVVFTDDAKARKLAKSMGSGAKSRVFEIDNDPSRVAKVLHPSVFANDHSFDSFFKRVSTLMNLELAHESLVLPDELIYDTNGPDKNAVGYLMERVNGGKTLHALLNQGELSFTERITIISQLASVLTYLQEKHNISVPDLRLDNLMLDMKKSLKIIDSDGFDIPGAPQENSNNFLYNPPSVGFTGDATAFRFAAISFQILAGRHPFLNPSTDSIRDAINDLRFILTPDRQDIMRYLSEELRYAYIDTFVHGKTTSMTQWKELWSDYLEDILEAMKGYSAI